MNECFIFTVTKCLPLFPGLRSEWLLWPSENGCLKFYIGKDCMESSRGVKIKTMIDHFCHLSQTMDRRNGNVCSWNFLDLLTFEHIWAQWSSLGKYKRDSSKNLLESLFHLTIGRFACWCWKLLVEAETISLTLLAICSKKKKITPMTRR